MKVITPRQLMQVPDRRPLWTPVKQIQQMMGDRTYTFDANMGLSDGAAAYTATGYAQYGGADAIIDLGGNQNVTITLPSIADVASIVPQQARIDAVAVLDLTAIKTSSGNELYKFIVVGCNNPAFNASVQQLAMLELGHTSVLDQLNGLTTPAPPSVGGSRYEIPFASEQNNVKYEYVKLYLVLSGTTPSVSFRGFVAVLPEP